MNNDYLTSSMDCSSVTFGESIKILRSFEGLTQSNVASDLGVGIRTYQRWESGEYYPKQMDGNPLYMYLKLANILDAKLAYSDKTQEIVLVPSFYDFTETYYYNEGFSEGYCAAKCEEPQEEYLQLTFDDGRYEEGFKAGKEYALKLILDHFSGLLETKE